eukprot:TRINITY_DN4249_c0_g1_i2.p1 TRINITY_DN4249_c0_g1~~TRINITY_DN4249_c0_g1_i2.p1  ORF type:complete len:1067 (+),score=202.62 TRINITY_DN4249_c0_g1_i2:59-3202(+)
MDANVRAARVEKLSRPAAGVNVKKYLVFGEAGSGKSTFINNIRSKSETKTAKAAKSPEGVTKTIDNFIAEAPDGTIYEILDAPGIGDGHVSSMAILDMIEAYMRGNKLESLDGVLLVLDIRNPRWGLGAQVVQKIFEKCFKGAQKWDSIIIVGSHRDKAEEGDEDNFRTMVQWFFQEAPESRRLSTFVTKKDASGIWDQLTQVPDAGISVQANKEDLNQALSKVFSDDDPKLKLAKDKVKRLDEQIAQCKLHIKDAGRKHRIACAVQVGSQFANFASLGVKGLVRGMNRDDLDKTLKQRDELLKAQEAAREDFERSKGLFEAKIEELRKKKCRLFTLCFPCTSADDQKHGSDEDIKSSLCGDDLADIMGCLDWCAKDMYSRLSERSRGKRAPYSEQELTKCVKGNFRRDVQERDEHWYKNPRTQFQEFLLKHAFRLPEEPPFCEAGWDGNHCERSLTSILRDARFKSELHKLRGEATQMQKADAPLETSQLECVESVFKPEVPSSQEVELLLHRGWSRQPFEPQRCVAELESIYKVTPDDSLFTSFSCALNECGRTVSPDDICQNTVEHIRSHLHDDLVGEIFTEEEFQRVLENMMKPGERDDDIAILAVEQKYRLPVRVWTDEQKIVQGPDGTCKIVYVQQRSNDKKHAINLLSKSVGDGDADSRCRYFFVGGTINMLQPGEMAGWEEIAPPREDSDSDDEDEDGDVLADLSNLEVDATSEESKFVKAMKKIRGAASSEMKKAFESVRLPKDVQDALSRCMPQLPPKDPTEFAIYCANFGFSKLRTAIMPIPTRLPFVPSAYPSTHGGGGGGVPAVPGAAPSVPGRSWSAISPGSCTFHAWRRWSAISPRCGASYAWRSWSAISPKSFTFHAWRSWSAISPGSCTFHAWRSRSAISPRSCTFHAWRSWSAISPRSGAFDAWRSWSTIGSRFDTFCAWRSWSTLHSRSGTFHACRICSTISAWCSWSAISAAINSWWSWSSISPRFGTFHAWRNWSATSSRFTSESVSTSSPNSSKFYWWSCNVISCRRRYALSLTAGRCTQPWSSN